MTTVRTPTAAVLAALLALAACGGDDTTAATSSPAVTEPPATAPAASEPAVTEPPATEPPATEPPATEPTATEPPATEPAATEPPTTEPPERVFRGEKYCEILLVRPVDGRIVAEVYNTFPLNACPVDEWEALDTAAIAEEFGAVAAVANGPRYWLMDRIDKSGGTAGPITTFGELEMYQQATVDITQMGMGAPPYTEVRVDRSARFSFLAGSTIFELTDPAGNRYVMQSYSQQVDPTIDESVLAELANRLTLPDGWTYAPRVLDADLTVDSTDEPAAVLQDEFKNTYSLED